MSVTHDPRIDELTAQVAALENRLLQAQKLTALGELMSTTTHEFNNILTTVINYARLGQRHKDDATRDKAFDKIMAAGQRAAKITQGVLGMARNRTAGFAPTDLAQIVQETLALLERDLTKHRIAIELNLQPAPEVPVNGNQIQQVLLNLLINARQAMPKGGRVLVSLEDHPEEGAVHLTVRDTGCGMEPDQMRRIFEPFFSTKTADEAGQGGTGLGLAACKQIIESHRGRIRVESTPNKGTAFTLKLPSQRSAA
jgi:signal transduction histidine kinase